MADNTGFDEKNIAIKRGMRLLELREWDAANSFFDAIIEVDATVPEAYIGRLCSKLRIPYEEMLINCNSDFYNESDFRKAAMYANETYKATLMGYVRAYALGKLQKQFDDKFNKACDNLFSANSEEDYENVSMEFEQILKDFNKSVIKKEWIAKVRAGRAEAIYRKAHFLTKKGNYEQAREQFMRIPGWKDADELASLDRYKGEERIPTEQKTSISNRNSKKQVMLILVFALLVVGIIIACIGGSVLGGKDKETISAEIIPTETNYTEFAPTEAISLEAYKDAAFEDFWNAIADVYEELGKGMPIIFPSYESELINGNTFIIEGVYTWIYSDDTYAKYPFTITGNLDSDTASLQLGELYFVDR